MATLTVESEKDVRNFKTKQAAIDYVKDEITRIEEELNCDFDVNEEVQAKLKVMLQDAEKALNNCGWWRDQNGTNYKLDWNDKEDNAIKEHFAFFDFDEGRYLVKYKSGKDIGDDIEDAISSYYDNGDDVEYEDVVTDVMNSFGVEWEFIPCRRYLI